MIIKSINGIDVLNKWINVATLLIKNLPIFAFSPNAHHYYQTGVLQNLQRKQLCFSIERFKNQKSKSRATLHGPSVHNGFAQNKLLAATHIFNLYIRNMERIIVESDYIPT